MNQAICAKLEAFFADFTYIHADKKATLLDPQKNPPGVYFLKKGHVRQYLVSEKGQELTIHIYEPGAFFPLHWAINGIKNQYYFETLTEVELYLAPKEQVIAYLNANPQILFDLSSRLLFGVSGLSKRIERQTFGNAYHRVISSLLYLSAHFGSQKGPRAVIRQHFTHEDVSQFAGITRERTSLQIEKLEKKGLLKYGHDHSIIIPKLAALENELLIEA